jgi:hypothetical protein
LGYGASSKVSLAKQLDNNDLVALKINELDDAALIGFESELAFFTEVPEHENILKLRGFQVEV